MVEEKTACAYESMRSKETKLGAKIYDNCSCKIKERDL
jgi:hypothetical protein